MHAAETWSCDAGCSELGSDTQLSNLDSRAAHTVLGFDETEQLVVFRKALGDPAAKRPKNRQWG